MQFTKSIVAAAALLALAPLTQAQVKTDGLLEFYGRAELSVDQLDDGNKYNRSNLSSNASRLGFKGSKKIGGLTGIWQIEQQVDFNLGGTQGLATRDTFVGLRGDFGTFRAGKFDTPFKVARGPFNLFGDQVGDLRNLTRVGQARFDERPNNTLEYQTPVKNGLQGKLAYSLHSAANAASSPAGVDTKDDIMSASLGYKLGNLDLILAVENYGAGITPAGDRKATRAAASYKVNKELTVMGFYQSADSTIAATTSPVAAAKNESADVTGLGFQYMASPKVALKAHYMNRKAEVANADSSMYTLGAEYRYDKALRFYANYAGVKNDSGIALNPWTQGRTTTTLGSNGKTSTGLSLGMRYDF
jgi:predicted porin